MAATSEACSWRVHVGTQMPLSCPSLDPRSCTQTCPWCGWSRLLTESSPRLASMSVLFTRPWLEQVHATPVHPHETTGWLPNYQIPASTYMTHKWNNQSHKVKHPSFGVDSTNVILFLSNNNSFTYYGDRIMYSIIKLYCIASSIVYTRSLHEHPVSSSSSSLQAPCPPLATLPIMLWPLRFLPASHSSTGSRGAWHSCVLSTTEMNCSYNNIIMPQVHIPKWPFPSVVCFRSTQVQHWLSLTILTQDIIILCS